jgi:hypothetical protein
MQEEGWARLCLTGECDANAPCGGAIVIANLQDLVLAGLGYGMLCQSHARAMGHMAWAMGHATGSIPPTASHTACMLCGLQ